MRLVQFFGENHERQVGLVQADGVALTVLEHVTHVRDLALDAHRSGRSLTAAVEAHASTTTVDYQKVIGDGRLLPPLDHPDPAHCILSGTGLDHLGSAQARNAMHAKLEGDDLTDSMKIFKIGVEGGKPAPGTIGSQPEWFYKGDGDWLAAPGQPLELPSFALDGGEEPELVGLYVIGDGGEVLRVGFALGNEFSDHVLEKQNYLYLAHSKLRNSSFGPELLVGEPPADIRGTARIMRGGQELWSGEFLTGEANMTYTLANIEHHHFKYRAFRRPGDVHCHFFGTATLSFAAGIQTQPGDVFEISAPGFGQPLRNPLQQNTTTTAFVAVKTL
ncbi:MAG TPA: GguC family protein [Caldilineaceae bacterium]|nr:GguC family protein [Caldilineaceae bacterium]